MKTKIHLDFKEQVRRYLRRESWRTIGELTVQFLEYALLIFSVFLVLNLLFELPAWLRWTFYLGLFVWMAGFTWVKIKPLLQAIFAPTNRQLFLAAKRIGEQYPQVSDRLINLLQLSDGYASSASEKLTHLAVAQLTEELRDIEFKVPANFSTLSPRLKIAGALLGAWLVLYVFFPGPLTLALKRSLIPWKDFKMPLPLQLVNKSGDRAVLKNDPVVLEGAYRGMKPERIYLLIREVASPEKVGQKTRVEKILLPSPTGNEFRFQMKHVVKPFEYCFRAELELPSYREKFVQSGWGRVTLRERPVIRNLQVKIIPPAYSGRKPRLLSPNEGEIAALKGSRAIIQVECNKQLTSARLMLSDSSEIPLTVRGNRAKGELRILRALQYKILVTDEENIPNGDPIEYSIYPLPDEYPYAEIKQPGEDLDLTDSLEIPLFVILQDDYGFSKLAVRGMVIRQGSTGDTNRFEISLPYKMLERGKAYHQSVWNLTPFYLVPDDYIQYFVEVWDNDRVSGPKPYRTAVFTIRLPSLLDVLAEAEAAQEKGLQEMEDQIKQTRELREKLEEINRQLKRDEQMDWERKEEIKKQLEKQKEVLEKLEEIKKDLEEVINRLDDRKMLSPETLEKYFELTRMFEELATPELKEAMRKLQEALEKADPKQIQKAMEQLQFSVEMFEKNVERTYELFKRVQLEQKFDQLTQMAEKLAQEQEKINRELARDSLPEPQMKRLAEREKNLQEEFNYLEKQIEETQQTYQELLQQRQQELAQAQEFARQSQIPESMQQMQGAMMAGDQSGAQNKGDQIQSKMKELQSLLQKAQQAFTNEQKAQLAEAMQKAIQDMLDTSFRQENLYRRTRNLGRASAQLNEIARQQAQLYEANRQIINQLIEIGKKSFFISPQMNQIMAHVMEQMSRAVANLEERMTNNAARAQQEAMAGLNAAILSMEGALNKMTQAASATGFQEFMKQLQQMAGQQGQLNQNTMNLFQQSQSGRLKLSPDDLARLAAQQEMIRQSLEQLNKQMGERRDVLGRLGELGQKMEEVVQELKARQLDRKVIERQEEILSRLLDAQKSIREKEYSKKRQAEREKSVVAKSPPELKKELLQREDLIRKALMEALDEGYSLEYRELIKKYFEILGRRLEGVQ